MNKDLEEDQIDLRNLFNALWKEKTLILITVILTFLSFYLYSLSFSRQFRTEIAIQYPPRQIFYEYKNFGIPITFRNEIDVDRTIQKEFIILNLNEQVVYDFNLNINSISNLDVFLDQNKEKEFDNFRVFYNKKNFLDTNYNVNNII
jgi:LPS O-antigen subunit length determinant protein (WzzB/FepE family)